MRLLGIGLVLLIGSIATPAYAELHAHNMWLRESVPGTPNGAGFGVLMNHTSDDIVVIGASSPAAETVEIHEHVHVDGEMRMQMIEALVVPVGEMITLQPGGYHFMLFGLKQPLQVGDEYEFTLYFADGSEQSFTMPVKSLNSVSPHQH